MEKFNSIGLKQSFVDAREKVTGSARYLDDLEFPGLLTGKILRSPYPHARILSIDTSAAEALPGVKAVITAKDCPQNKFGMEIADVDMLAVEKVRYVGDEVAAVAAENDEIAREALKLIKVEYEELPVVDDPVKAMEKDSPLVHEEKGTNVAREYHIQRGDIEADFASCDYVFEKEFSTHRVSGLYLEPFGAVAQWESNGRLTVWTGLQSAFQGRNEIAKALGIKPTQVTVKSPFIGGGFGAKGRGTAYDAPAYRAAYEGQAWHDEGRHDGLQAGDDRRRQRSLFMGRAEGAAEPFDAYRLPLQI